MGLAMAYGVDKVWAFVESLRRHYDGPAALLVSSRGPPELVDYLVSRNIQVHIFDCAIWMVAHFQVSRYIRYYEILKTPGVCCDRVLLTDVSDVVFQGDPFAGAPEGELLFFMEDAKTAIGQSTANSLWIRDVYGPQVLAQLSQYPISCSGTTMGSQAAILRYLEKLLSYARPDLMPRLVERRGHDQGIHNYILHTGQLPDITRVQNGVHVLTLGVISEGELAVSDSGIASGGGRICPVVHQYNYQPAAQNWVDAHYAYSGVWHP